MNMKIDKRSGSFLFPEEVRGMVNHSTPAYWDKHFPFYHRKREYLVIFTESGIYQVYFDKPRTELVRIKRRYRKKGGNK